MNFSVSWLIPILIFSFESLSGRGYAQDVSPEARAAKRAEVAAEELAKATRTKAQLASLLESYRSLKSNFEREEFKKDPTKRDLLVLAQNEEYIRQTVAPQFLSNKEKGLKADLRDAERKRKVMEKARESFLCDKLGHEGPSHVGFVQPLCAKLEWFEIKRNLEAGTLFGDKSSIVKGLTTLIPWVGVKFDSHGIEIENRRAQIADLIIAAHSEVTQELRPSDKMQWNATDQNPEWVELGKDSVRNGKEVENEKRREPYLNPDQRTALNRLFEKNPGAPLEDFGPSEAPEAK